MKRNVTAHREPNGRRKRAGQSASDKTELEMISVVMRQPHRVLVPDMYRRSQHAESPIGRLFLLGVIDSEDLSAAILFRSICVAYHRAIGAPRGLQSNADLDKIKHFGVGVVAEDLDETKARDRWRGIKARYEEATETVKFCAGSHYEAFIRLVVEDLNEPIPDRILRSCLSHLARLSK